VEQVQACVHFLVAVGGGTFGTWKFPEPVNIIMSVDFCLLCYVTNILKKDAASIFRVKANKV
jgi:hypothetical protein